MYYFVIHALPDPTHDRDPEAQGAAGAFVSCWVDFKDLEGATLLAKHYIARAGWIPEDPEPEQIRRPSRDDYLDRTELRYFDQAVEDGVCLCFVLYPEEDEDATP